MANGQNNLDKIEHVVVLMLENRSFDNVLGWLYDPDNPAPFNKVPRGQSFEGLSGQKHCNPRPDGGEACAGKGTVMTDPFPDPNEPYDHVLVQMYYPFIPVEGGTNTTDTPTMNGFVVDFANAIATASQQPSGCSRILSSLVGKSSNLFDIDPGVIMNGFAPASLPVINGLANAYAVCDHWFSSVPTQTFPNRSFVHAATSSGYVTNFWSTGPHKWDIAYLLNKTDTVFNLLSKAEVDWRIYHGGPFLLCNALIIQEKLWDFVPFGHHFSPLAKFYEDASRPNGLPSYTFIEPNMLCSKKYGPENDMHPAFAITNTGAATNVTYGDSLIYLIYEALLNSPDWNSTLFIITFDEHGGCYDHVPTPPPLATPPDDKIIPVGQPGWSGFQFNRFGVRVPTVLVSPLIEQGTVCNTALDHTSIIKTLSNRWLSGQKQKHLTKRDEAAADVSEVLTLSEPRKDKPPIAPNPVPLFSGCGNSPLSDLQRHMVGLAAHHVERLTGRKIDPDTINTTDEAVETFDNYETVVKSVL